MCIDEILKIFIEKKKETRLKTNERKELRRSPIRNFYGRSESTWLIYVTSSERNLAIRRTNAL